MAVRFSLKDLTATAKGNFDAGSIQVFYHGTSMGITSQVSIVSAIHHLAFESVETEAMDFASTTLNGIAWTPDDETQAKLALTNTTSSPLDITTMGNEKVESMTLKGRETRVIDLKEYLGDSRATLVTLNHHGPLGALIATGFALNQESGFSTNLNFVDCATAKTTRLAAAHVRFGYPDPQEGFPAGTSFRAPLVVANTMDMPTEAHISVTYTVQSTTKTVQLTPIRLGARAVKLIELSKQMALNGVSGPVEDAGVDISYTDMPGTVIGRLTSYDASEDYAFDVPVKDPIGQGNGGYPWRLDNGYSTVVHLKNTLDKEVSALVQVRYDGGTYHPDRIKLGPYQTIAIDIRQLRDAQEKDIRGGVMPKDVESGQFVWSEEQFGSLMIGRAEVTNIKAAVASSFSCPGGCSCSSPVFSSASMNPPSASAEVGFSGSMFAPTLMKKDCLGVLYGPYSPTSTITWSSSNTSVVTVNSAGVETTVGPGSASISTVWQEIVSYTFDCGSPVYGNVGCGANLGVRPRINSITPTRGLIGNTIAVSIDGQGFGVFPSVSAGDGITATVNFANSTSFHLDASFAISATSSGGNHAVTVTVSGQTSNSMNFFVQIPSRFERFDYPGAPGGYGPLTLTSSTNNNVIDLAGNVKKTNQCGVYRNLVYELKDQEGQPITQPFDITETFSNYSGVSTLPGNENTHSSAGLLQDTMYFGKTLPNCPGPDDNESFDQRFIITISGTPFSLTTIVHVSRGRFSGNWAVDVTTTTP